MIDGIVISELARALESFPILIIDTAEAKIIAASKALEILFDYALVGSLKGKTLDELFYKYLDSPFSFNTKHTTSNAIKTKGLKSTGVEFDIIVLFYSEIIASKVITYMIVAELTETETIVYKE